MPIAVPKIREFTPTDGRVILNYIGVVIHGRKLYEMVKETNDFPYKQALYNDTNEDREIEPEIIDWFNKFSDFLCGVLFSYFRKNLQKQYPDEYGLRNILLNKSRIIEVISHPDTTIEERYSYICLILMCVEVPKEREVLSNIYYKYVITKKKEILLDNSVKDLEETFRFRHAVLVKSFLYGQDLFKFKEDTNYDFFRNFADVTIRNEKIAQEELKYLFYNIFFWLEFLKNVLRKKFGYKYGEGIPKINLNLTAVSSGITEEKKDESLIEESLSPRKSLKQMEKHPTQVSSTQVDLDKGSYVEEKDPWVENTKMAQASPKRDQRCRMAFRWTENPNIPPELFQDESRLQKMLTTLDCKEYYYQLERNSITGKLHWQGFFNLKKKQSAKKLAMELNPAFFDIQLQVAFYPKQLIKYSTKPETRVKGPYYVNNLKRKYSIEPSILDKRIASEGIASEGIANKETLAKTKNNYMKEDLEPIYQNPYPWQTFLKQRINQNLKNSRQLLWIYDPVGNVGKSLFCKSLVAENKSDVFSWGCSQDLLYAACLSNKDTYVFDFTRPKPVSIDWDDVYSAIESVKNGFFFNPKCDSSSILRSSPHVICFSNILPNLRSLNADHWEVYRIGNQTKNAIFMDIPQFKAFYNDMYAFEETKKRSSDPFFRDQSLYRPSSGLLDAFGY